MINYCESLPCVNGLCFQQPNGYSCLCTTGYTGTNCNFPINSCTSNPCGASGSCINGQGNYTCQCYAGYAGVK